jgi:hypothetical protein
VGESEDIRSRARRLYRAPFRYEMGYIYDAGGEMVSDGRVDKEDQPQQLIVQRVRGWGRIGYLADAEQLQDTVGALIAEALTRFWTEADRG